MLKPLEFEKHWVFSSKMMLSFNMSNISNYLEYSHAYTFIVHKTVIIITLWHTTLFKRVWRKATDKIHVNWHIQLIAIVVNAYSQTIFYLCCYCIPSTLLFGENMISLPLMLLTSTINHRSILSLFSMPVSVTGYSTK